MNERRRILVSGGSSGIGRALCRQLAADHGCDVLLGARNAARGAEAVEAIHAVLDPDGVGSVSLIELDVGDSASVARAAERVRSDYGEAGPLHAVVNNAGTGLAHGVSPDEVVDTNLYGPKRVVDAFVAGGLVSDRVVNVGSGSGPGYVRRCPLEAQPALCTTPADWPTVEAFLERSADGATGLGSAADSNGGYGISKALLTLYTMLLAKDVPSILSSCVSPGWIRTKLVGHDGPSKGPEEGTASLLHALFADLEGNGWYYGSDTLRSPLHYMRNPGEPAWDGVVDGVVGVG